MTMWVAWTCISEKRSLSLFFSNPLFVSDVLERRVERTPLQGKIVNGEDARKNRKLKNQTHEKPIIEAASCLGLNQLLFAGWNEMTTVALLWFKVIRCFKCVIDFTYISYSEVVLNCFLLRYKWSIYYWVFRTLFEPVFGGRNGRVDCKRDREDLLMVYV